MSNVPGVGVTSHRLSRFTATAPATRSCPASGDWIEPILARSESNRSLNGGLSSSDPLRILIGDRHNIEGGSVHAAEIHLYGVLGCDDGRGFGSADGGCAASG